ncbi:MAG: hypothetical protein ACYC66_05880 [Chloroflexota bacterium]
MEYGNVPSSRTVLTGASLWMAALAALSANSALAAGSAGQSIPLALVSGTSIAAALGFGKLALVDFGRRADSQLRRRMTGNALAQRADAHRSAKAA